MKCVFTLLRGLHGSYRIYSYRGKLTQFCTSGCLFCCMLHVNPSCFPHQNREWVTRVPGFPPIQLLSNFRTRSTRILARTGLKVSPGEEFSPSSPFSWLHDMTILIRWGYSTGQDKAIKNCSPDHDRGGVKIQKKVRIAYSEFSHLWADHLAGPSNISYA